MAEQMQISTDAGPSELTPLRSGLKMFRAEDAEDASPAWTLHDPFRQKFYRLGWPEFEIVSRWHLGNPQQILQQISAATPLRLTLQRIEELSQFLKRNHLLRASEKAAIDDLKQQHLQGRKSWWQKLSHNYLFFRIPLIYPDRWLQGQDWVGRLLFTRHTAFALVLLALLGSFLTMRQWDRFSHSFMEIFSLEGLLIAAGAIILAKTGHEFGHAFMARKYGCRVSSMGVAFIVAWPVLYTDTTDAWKLTDRRQRLHIALAGLAVELAIAILASVCWSLLPAGPWQTGAVLVASVTWISSLAINLNPFMKFDGYYLASDFLRFPNLQERAFNFARWRLRRFLFGWRQPAPENFRTSTARLLLLYAYTTWLYRLALYIAIGLIVYHFAFKLAGIILLAFELTWFVGLPVYREVSSWFKGGSNIRFGLALLRSFLLLVFAGWLLFYPFERRLQAPAVLQSANEAQILTPYAGQVLRLHAEAGDYVQEGALLAELGDEELESRIARNRQRIAAITWQINRVTSGDARLAELSVAREQLGEILSEQTQLLDQRQQLQVRAPFSGRIVEKQDSLRTGMHLGRQAPLYYLVDPDQVVIEAYLAEEDLEYLSLARRGEFLAEKLEDAPLPVIAYDIAPRASDEISRRELTSAHDGPIPVRPDERGRLVPEKAVYQALLRPQKLIRTPAQWQRGTVFFQGRKASFAERAFDKVAAILIRESGF